MAVARIGPSSHRLRITRFATAMGLLLTQKGSVICSAGLSGSKMDRRRPWWYSRIMCPCRTSVVKQAIKRAFFGGWLDRCSISQYFKQATKQAFGNISGIT